MKKLLISWITLTAVILFSLAGCRPVDMETGESEPAVPAESSSGDVRTTTVDTTDSDTAVSEPESDPQSIEVVVEEDLDTTLNSVTVTEAEEAILAPGLPVSGGRGGGGYGYDGGPFTNATLTLDTTLPEGEETAVYALPMPRQPGEVDEEQLRAFAENLGITGDIYFEWYDGMPVDGQNDGGDNGPYVYRIFDGQRQVSAFVGGEWSYEDTSYYRQMEMSEPLPFDERAAIAEQFLMAHNLLDSDYEIHPSWGNEVQFLSQVNGRVVHNWATLSANVSSTGEIMSIYYRPLQSLTEIETAVVRPAAEAWQFLQENLEEGPVMFNIIPSNPAYYAPYPSTGETVHWEREFAPGQDVTLNSWIQVYRPADSSATPRLMTDRGMVLAADDGTLEAIANATGNGNNIRLQGTITGDPNNMVLNVTSWEGIMGPTDVYLNGTTRKIDDIVVLELPGGFPIQIANPPADLPMDTLMSMSSWSVRVADDGVSAIADWVMLDSMEHYAVEPERPFEDPYSNITDVTITEVELVYYYLYPYESLNPYQPAPFRANDNSHLVPVWRFSGETNNGDLVEFTIQALASEELSK